MIYFLIGRFVLKEDVKVNAPRAKTLKSGEKREWCFYSDRFSNRGCKNSCSKRVNFDEVQIFQSS